MDHWASDLRDDLDRLEARHLRRRLFAFESTGRTISHDGTSLLNLASNDYLGLSQHPHLRDAVIEATKRFGVGAGASPLVSGHLSIHERLELRFAKFKHAEAALLCPTGYMANLATITALAGPKDAIFVDKLTHASLLDAARASSAHVRFYPHLNLSKLTRLLERQRGSRRRLIVTDSVFSMDGDVADLAALCEIADRFDAILVVDEAHGTGVLGPSGAGLCEMQGVAERVDVVVSTASKALGSIGGIITARREVVDTLINRARPFIYSTSAPPTQPAGIDAALDVLRDEPGRRQRIQELAIEMRTALSRLAPPGSLGTATPIIPLITGTAQAALGLSEYLRRCGLLVPAIRPPTVPSGQARVRMSLRADLQDADLNRVIDAVRKWQRDG